MNIEPLLTRSNSIMYPVIYGKSSEPVGRLVPLDDFTKKSTREIVGKDQRVIAAYHDWNAKKVIPSITLHMNITETAGEYLYTGGTN